MSGAALPQVARSALAGQQRDRRVPPVPGSCRGRGEGLAKRRTGAHGGVEGVARRNESVEHGLVAAGGLAPGNDTVEAGPQCPGEGG